jgi:MFS transporter, FHS family, glucose/mannose:H+ symporter
MYNRSSVFASGCLGLLLFGMGLITLGSVAPDLKEKFQLDEIGAGTIFSILPIGILAGSLLFGPLCDKYGYKLFLILSALFMFAGFQGIAHASSFSLLAFCIFLFGLGGGIINGASNAVVSDISTGNKGANLSLLGVSFAIGALGMPLVLGMLESRYAFDTIVSAVGFVALLAAVFFFFTTFPPPKQSQGIPLARSLALFKDNVLILIAFFLFCQSSFEGIINNWTTTYLLEQIKVEPSSALFALTLYVVGMAVMRLLIGSVGRAVPSHIILFFSFGLLLLGCLLLEIADSFQLAVSGLILIGAGLAAGFPIMLGWVGSRYAELSGTAFSFVLVVALIGNMAVNFMMGILAETYGIHLLPTVAFIEVAAMVLLTWAILKKINQPTPIKTSYASETMA